MSEKLEPAFSWQNMRQYKTIWDYWNRASD